MFDLVQKYKILDYFLFTVSFNSTIAQLDLKSGYLVRKHTEPNNNVKPPANAKDSKDWACTTFLLATAGKTENVPKAASFGTTVTFLHVLQAAANM